MKCPICGQPTSRENPDRPFCSERCRMIDLGNWASENYRVPSEPADYIAVDEQSQMEDAEAAGDTYIN